MRILPTSGTPKGIRMYMNVPRTATEFSRNKYCVFSKHSPGRESPRPGWIFPEFSTMLNNQTDKIFSWISMEVIFHPMSTDRIFESSFYRWCSRKVRIQGYLLVRLFLLKDDANIWKCGKMLQEKYEMSIKYLSSFYYYRLILMLGNFRLKLTSRVPYFTIPMQRLHSSKAQRCKDFW